MKRIICIFLIIVGISVYPAFAKEGKSKNMCGPEVKQTCGSMKGQEKRSCIQKNLEKFSEPCRAQLAQKRDRGDKNKEQAS